MLYKCPYCDKYFDTKRKLNRHIARVHPEAKEAEPEVENDDDDDEELENDTFKIEKPAYIKEALEYHCLACGAPLNKGDNPCPACGAQLEWGAVS